MNPGQLPFLRQDGNVERDRAKRDVNAYLSGTVIYCSAYFVVAGKLVHAQRVSVVRGRGGCVRDESTRLNSFMVATEIAATLRSSLRADYIESHLIQSRFKFSQM